MIAHEKTITWIKKNKLLMAKVLISACGQQMYISAKSCSIKCIRKDKVSFYPEQTIRYNSGRANRYGEPINDHYRLDAVLYIRPGTWGLNQFKNFSVGIEIKENVEDLRRDEKIMKYLGWTDFFLIMVPSALTEEALRKIKQLGDPHIGLLSYSIDSCRVVKTPQRQKEASIENKFALAMQSILGRNSIGYSAEG